ncbi:hypothetical protein RUM43_005736 [Polyplax serrata]|uniref:Uncharacterized protein n=1 Tax=Polyplax serrata TaxID=468196 RepID=A0AAN8P0E5_POLSC
MDYQAGKAVNLRTQTEQMLHNAVLITEMAMDLKDRSLAGEKYVCYLRSLAVRAARAIVAMKNSGKSFLVLAQRMANSAIKTMEMVPSGEASFQNLKIEYEKLLLILERELSDIDDHESTESFPAQELGQINLSALSEKIRFLETKQKQSDSAPLPQASGSKTFKPGEDDKVGQHCDNHLVTSHQVVLAFCELSRRGVACTPPEVPSPLQVAACLIDISQFQYPESWSRESLIDLNCIMNLPPVPENIFIGLAPTRPVRSSSLSSLKSLRKVKLSLQRAARDSSEDEEESGSEETEETASSDDARSQPGKKMPASLDNITEEPSS